ncbi:MAG: AAA family ATPase [Catonella sp.]|nr:AAA family ATPase [Catonella sp.]MDY6356427.1 AAA family ATPase [Catonella sp.]
MDRIYIRDLKIKKVRHLENIDIPISPDEEMRHLLLTGENGSGKTSVLTALAGFLDNATKNNNTKIEGGIELTFNLSDAEISQHYKNGEFIIAFYMDFRRFDPVSPKQIEKVELMDSYDIINGPRNDFLKYLLDMKMMQAMAVADGKQEDADRIKGWFDNLTNLLKKIYGNDKLELEFDRDHYNFLISIPGREKFDFKTMSSGYAAVIDIVVDLMLRMEKQTGRNFKYDMPGIVLIDEIETHLHLSLQKQIMKILTGIFPNIQFIVSTHSPFVLNSIDEVTIYDLENRTLVKNGLSDVPYEGVVEGYFNVNTMSDELKDKFVRYKELISKSELTADEEVEIYSLEHDLDEIPDFLALDESTEYERMKLEYHNRRENSVNG